MQEQVSTYNISKYKDSSEATLIRRLRDGADGAAFACIYQRYNKLLYAIAYRYLKDTDMVEDIVQQVFLKLWESRKLLQEDMSIRNFLYTMTRNRVLNEIRDNATAIKKSYEMMQGRGEADNSTAQHIEDKDMVAAFRSTLDTLPPRQRQVCSYRIEEGLSAAETAERMNVQVSTVRTLFQIGMKTIRAKMKRMMMLFFIIFPTI